MDKKGESEHPPGAEQSEGEAARGLVGEAREKAGEDPAEPAGV